MNALRLVDAGFVENLRVGEFASSQPDYLAKLPLSSNVSGVVILLFASISECANRSYSGESDTSTNCANSDVPIISQGIILN